MVLLLLWRLLLLRPHVLRRVIIRLRLVTLVALVELLLKVSVHWSSILGCLVVWIKCIRTKCQLVLVLHRLLILLLLR